METWDLLDDPAGAPAWNMALDEVLLLTAADRGRPLLRIYSWTEPAVSFGYFQAFPAHLADRYAIVRRPTGGGVVYHGQDTTYSVVVPRGHPLYASRPADAYCRVHRAVAAAFADEPSLHRAPLTSPRGEYECFEKPVEGDVVIDGRKLAGGAQRRTRHGMLHQGSIDHPIPSDQLARGFARELNVRFEPWAIPAAVRGETEKLAREKYGTEAWNRKRSA